MRPRLTGVGAAVLALVVAACSSSSKPTVPTTIAPPASTTTTAVPVTGSLKVLAAASLTGAFNAAKPTLETANPGLAITYDFAGSNALATQITNGAPADVFASADQANMQRLVAAGLVDPPVAFARNHLEIAVAPGNPKHIAGLADLAKAGVSSVLESQGVPAGDYTRQVEAQLGITITPKSLEPDVKTAIAQVTSGEVDATVVYVTDVRAAGATVVGVPIPATQQPDISYPIAMVKASHNQAAAAAFIDSARSGAVQQDLVAQGFLAP